MSDHNIRDDDESIVAEILQRSATDREFRALLLAEPASAVEQVIGVPVATLPRPINVQFVEKRAGLDALIVLPDFIEVEGALSDAELEAVAGGVDVSKDTCICTGCCLTCITTSGYFSRDT